jgi:hypothetical protein
MHPMRARRWWIVVSVSALAAACTGSAPPAPSATPAPLTGELLTITGTQASTLLVRYTLRDGSASTLPAPIDPEAVNRTAFAGAPTEEGGTVFITANAGTAQVYRLDAGANEAAPLGPALHVVGDEPLLSVDANGALVADGRTVSVLPLPAAEHWAEVGTGGWAALSPDGASVASSPDGRQVVIGPVGSDAGPEVAFSTDELRGSLGRGAVRPTLIGIPEWGPAGLAFMVRAGDQFAVFVRGDDGKIVEALQEQYANVFRVPRIAWQPSGGLLAIADDVSPSGAVLRVFDPSAGKLTAISLAPVGFAGTAWAPDGTSVALVTGAGELVVVDLEGGWLLQRETDWRGVLGWSGAA